MNRYTTAALCALALLMTSAEAWADTMPVAADSSINLGAVNQINGSDQNLPVRNTGAGGVRQAFLTFDLGALPASTRVARATLRLWVSTVATPGSLEIRRVSDPWQEATITAANAPAPGALVANASIGASDLGRVVSIDVTALAQDWSNGGDNNGLVIRPDPAGLVRVAFDSRESVGHGPEIEIVPGLTRVDTGVGLLGGPVTSTGTISLDTGFTDGRYAQLLSPNTFSGQQVFNNTIGSSAVVGNTFSPLSAYGLLGYAQATSGPTSGVTGASLSTSGVGVAGIGEATTGVTTGVRGTVASPAGTAGVFDNGAGGRLLFGSVNGVARFRVEGDGSIHNTGGVTAGGTVTAAAFVGDGSQLTNIAAVTEVTAGVGLLGGPVTSTGTISLDTGFTDGRYAQLLSPNTFSGQQVFNNTIGSSAVVGNTFSPLSAYGLLGYAQATSGDTSGVTGASLSTSGVGVAGIGEATSGVTTGVRGTVASPAGTAGVFDNGAGGRLLLGAVNGVTRFRVEGDGSIHNSGGITADGTVTAAAFVGDGSQLTNIPAGPQGPIGPQGAQGPEGPQGVQGPQGAAGFTPLRTIIVSPVPGDAAASGAALQSAVAQTSSSSPANPWLIRIEPGVFDVGSPLDIPSHVHVEGSGEGITVVTKAGGSSSSDATVRMSSNSELRWLSVENRGGDAFAVGVNAISVSNVRLSHITVDARDGSTLTYGVMVQASSATVADSTLLASHPSYYAVGFVAHTDSHVTLRASRVIATVPSGDAIAVFNGQSDVRIADVTAEAHGSGNALGIYVAGFGNVPTSNGSEISNTLATADGGSDAHGIEVAGGAFAELQGVRSRGTASGLRLRTTGSQSGVTLVRSIGSTIEGPTGVLVLGAGYDTRFSGGQIRGAVSGTGLSCVFVSDGAFAARDGSCQP